ncbi:MAG TPA: site-2 protease family protein [Candidatus Faecimorpha stercoravium]|nr:site-2 protease family protein [Candidatus Faecimorpha stercoravium]
MNQWPLIWEQIKLLIYTAPATLLAISAHEFAHGLVSYWLGDPTPKRDGRLSLNPLHHLDLVGTICMLVFRFGWAKPVKVNPQYYKNPKQGMALTALAGPVMNLILAFLFLGIFVGLFHVTEGSTEGILGYLMLLAQYTAIMNIGLGVFNLIPIPPLDGSKVLGIFLPQRTYFQLMRYERYGGLLMIVLLYTGVLSRPLGILRDGLLELMLRVWT